MPKPPNILLVDDTLENLQVLGDMLRHRGYKVRPVASGKQALRACSAQAPDLILLDINMPELNGYEVCERLKADPALAEIPVLFISALSDPGDKVKAFGVGGVDYITKPFRVEEVEARVATHVALRRQRQELQDNYDHIHALEETRKNLSRLIVHDMRNPLNAIKVFLEEVDERNPGLDPDSQNYLRRARAASSHLLDMANSLLDLSRMEEGVLTLAIEPVNLADLCREAAANAALQVERRRLSVTAGEEPPVAEVDRSLMLRVIQNILGNALKFTDRERGEIRMQAEVVGARVRVLITDNGPGIPAEYHHRIFDRYFQVREMQVPGVHSTGLGLSFCKLGVEAHGGSIHVESEPGRGSTFCLELPCRRPAAPESGA